MKKVFSLVVVLFCVVGSVWGQNPTVSAIPTSATCAGGTGSVTATISNLTGPYDVYLIRGTGVPPLGYQAVISGTTESVVKFNDVPVGSSYNVQVKISNAIKAFATNINVGQPTQFKESTTPVAISGECGELGYISAEYSGGTTNYTFTLISDKGYNKTITQTSGNVLFDELPEGIYTFTANDRYGCKEFTTSGLTIISPAAIVGEVVDGSIVPVKCNGGKTGGVTIATQGGVAPFYYYLDGSLYDVNNTGTLIVTELFGGLHIVTVVDANGCYVDVGFDIPEPTTPVVISKIIPTDVTCGVNNGSITIEASGGTGSLSYSLDGGTTTQSSNVFTGVPAGDYTITMIDENGCSKTSTTTIKNIPLTVDIVVDENVLCKEAATGKAHATVTGGDNSSIVQYTWTGPAGFLGGNTANITNAKAGTYTVEVRNASGCVAMTTEKINEPDTKLEVEAAATQQNSCFGDAIGIAIAKPKGGTISDSSDYKYKWNTGQTTKRISNLAGGLYTVTVTDKENCTAQDTAAINPVAELTIVVDLINNVSCKGDNNGSIIIHAEGGTLPYKSYAWTPVNFTTPIINGLTPGDYQVTVTDDNDCTATSEQITISEPALALSATATLVKPSCSGDNDGSITVNVVPNSGTAPYQYSKDGGVTYQSGNVFNGLSAGSYPVWVKDANDCIFDFNKTPQSLQEPKDILFNITQDPDPLPCYDGSVTLKANVSGYEKSRTLQFRIDGGAWQTDSSFTSVKRGNHTIEARYSGTQYDLCQPASQSKNVTAPQAVTFTAVITQQPTCNNLNNGIITISVSGGTSPYLYSVDGPRIVSDTTSNVIDKLPAGTYTIKVKDKGVCTTAPASQQLTLTVPPAIIITDPVVVNVTCPGGNNGSITVNASGGTGNLSYSLNGGLAQPTGVFTGLFARTGNNITVTDANGCQAVRSGINVTQPATIPNVNATADEDTIECANGTAKISVYIPISDALSEYEYSLDNATWQTETVFNVIAGDYIVYVRRTDLDASCSSNQSALISIKGKPDDIKFTLTPTETTCFNETDGTITISNLQNGTSPYIYNLIKKGETILDYEAQTGGAHTFTGLDGGTYTVLVVDKNGCMKEGSPVIVTKPTAVTIDSETHADVKCFGDSNGTITVTASGGTGSLSYSLSGGTPQATGVFTGLAAASNYVITVTDANNCQPPASVTVTISQPNQLDTLRIDRVNALCNGGTGSATVVPTGGTAPYTYTWTGISATGATATNLVPGVTYTVVITDKNNCTTAAYPVKISQPTDLKLVLSEKKDISCANLKDGYIRVTASGGTPDYTYELNGQSFNNPEFFDLIEGTYSINVVDKNNCQATTDPTPIRIRIPSPVTGSFVVMKPILCNGRTDGELRFDASGGGINGTHPTYSYVWSNGSQNNTAINLGAGSRWVKIGIINIVNSVNDTTCVTRFDYNLTQPDTLTVKHDSVNVTCNGANNGTISLDIAGGTQPYSIAWTAPGGYSSTDKNLTGLAPNIYTYTVKDANNCNPVTGQVDISAPDPIDFISLSVDAVACAGESTTLTVSATDDANEELAYSLDGITWQKSNEFQVSVGNHDVYVGYWISATEAKCVQPPHSVNVSGRAQIVIDKIDVANPVLDCNQTSTTVTITASIIGGGNLNNLRYNMGNGWQTSNQFLLPANSAGYPVCVQYADESHCPVCIDTTVLIKTNVSIDITSVENTEMLDCPESTGGTITVHATGDGRTLEYSIGGAYVDNEGLFTGLSKGKYPVTVRYQGETCAQSYGEVEIKAPATIQISNVDVGTATCAADLPTTIKVTATGETGRTIQYSIDGGVTWPQSGTSGQEVIFNGVQAGPYNVMARYQSSSNPQNCGIVPSVSGIIATVPVALSINSINIDPLCAGQTNTLIHILATGQTTGGYSMEYGVYDGTTTTWYPVPDISLPAGAYEISVRYRNYGCETPPQPVIINALAAINNISATGANDLPCAVPTAKATVTVTIDPIAGNPAMRYIISDGFNPPISNDDGIFELPIGSYTACVEYADNNACPQCVADPVIINSNSPIPPVTLTTINGVTRDTLNCKTANTKLLVNPHDDDYRYSLNGGVAMTWEDLEDMSVPEGTWAVKVWDVLDETCFQTSNTVAIIQGKKIVINDNNVAITQPLCPNETGSVTVTLTGYGQEKLVYILRPQSGPDITNNDGKFTSLPGGTYKLTVKYAKLAFSECEGAYSKNIDILSSPADISNIVLTTGVPELMCTGSTTTLKASASGNRQFEFRLDGGDWKSVAGMKEYTFTNVGGGSHTVDIRYAGSGTNCMKSASITIKEWAPIVMDVDVASLILACGQPNTTITLHVTQKENGKVVDFSIDGGQTWISNGSSDTYTFTVTDGNYTPAARYRDNPGCILLSNDIRIDKDINLTVSALTSPSTTLNCANDKAAITIVATGDANRILQFTLDGNNWIDGTSLTGTDTHTFTDLPAGKYDKVAVRYQDNPVCPKTYPVITISAPDAIQILSVTPATPINLACNSDRATITVNAEGSEPMEFSIRDGEWQSGNIFNDVEGGTYLAKARYINGGKCEVTASQAIVVNQPEEITIKEVKVGGQVYTSPVELACNSDLTTIQIIATGDQTRTLEYSIDGVNFLPTTLFSNVGPRTYHPMVRYRSSDPANNCPIVWDTNVEISIPDPITANIYAEYSQLACDGSQKTRIIFDIIGSDSQRVLEYSIDGSAWVTDTAMLQKVGMGQHMATVRYQGYGCAVSAMVTVTSDGSIQGVDLSADNLDLNCGEKTRLRVSVVMYDSNEKLQYRLRDGSGKVTAWQTSDEFTLKPGGTYVAEVSYINDVSCIQYSNPLTITQPVAIDISNVYVGSSALACHGDATDIIVTANGQGETLKFMLTPEGSTAIENTTGIFTVGAGRYNLSVVYNNTGYCPADYPTIEITEPAEIKFSPVTGATTVACAGDKASITVNVIYDSNRKVEYSVDGINWQDDKVLLLGIGTYNQIQVRYKQPNPACAVPYGQTVTITGPAPIVIDHIDLDKNMVDCSDLTDKATITVTATGAGLVYSFDGGLTYQTDNFKNVGSGVYNICVAYGDITTQTCPVCSPDPVVVSSNSDIVIVNTALTGDIQCNGGTTGLTVTVSGSSAIEVSLGLDADNDGLIDWFPATGGTYTFTGLVAGKYHVSARYLNDNCVKVSGLINITEPNPVELSLVTYTNVAGCKGETPGTAIIGGMGGSGSYEYSLDDSSFKPMMQNPFTIIGLTLGNHTLALRDTKGCAASDTIQLPIVNPDSMIISYDISNIRCYGEANGRITLKVKNGHAPYEVTLINDLGQNIRTGYLANTSDELIFDNLASGFYWVQFIDAKPCKQLIRVQILQPAGPLEANYIGYNICPLNQYGQIYPSVQGGWPDYISYWYSRASDSDDYAPMYADNNGNAIGGKVPILFEIKAGQYQIVIKDQTLCADTTWVNIVKLTEYDGTAVPHGVRCTSLNSGSVKIIDPKGGNGGPYWFRVRDANTNLPVPGFEKYKDYQNDSIYGLPQGKYYIDMKDSIDVIEPDKFACNPFVMSANIGVEEGISIDTIFIAEAKCFDNKAAITAIKVDGTVHPLEYRLEYPDGTISSWQDSQVFGNLSGGNYIVHAREKAGGDGCETKKDTTIVIPAELQLIYSVTEPKCELPAPTLGHIDITTTGGTGQPKVTYNGVEVLGGVQVDPITNEWMFSQEIDKGGKAMISVTDAHGCIKQEVIDVPYTPGLQWTQRDSTLNECPGDQIASITALAASLSGYVPSTLTYNLYEGEIAMGTPKDTKVKTDLLEPAVFSGLANGTYTVSVHDDKNPYCYTDDWIVEIDNTNKIALTVDSTSTECKGKSTGRIAIKISGNVTYTEYKYSYDGGTLKTISAQQGVATISISNLAEGTHPVEIHYGNCVLIRPVKIGVKSEVLPKVTAVDISGCFGNSNGALKVKMPDIIVTPYSYWYSNMADGTFEYFVPENSDSTTIDNLPRGEYKLVVKDDNGCLSDTITKSIKDAPPMVIDTTVIVPIDCKGHYGTIGITISGGQAPYTVTVAEKPDYAEPPLLTGSGSSFTLDHITGGLYKISVVDASGCSNDLELDIYAPRVVEITATQPAITCDTYGKNTTIKVDVIKPASGTFEYSLNGGQPVISGTTYTYNVPTGTYKIIVKDQSTGCLDTSNIKVNIPAPLSLSLPVTKVDHGNCYFTADMSINITGGAAPFTIHVNDTLTFQTSNTSTKLEGLAKGDYHVKLLDANNCHKDSIVKVDLPNEIKVQVISNDTIPCNQDGRGLIVLGPPSYSYQWENGKTGNVLRDLDAGDYKVTISNGSCSKDTVITVVAKYTIEVSIKPDGEDTHLFCPGTEVVLNGFVVINGMPMSSTTSDAFANWILPNGDAKEFLGNNPLIQVATNGTIQLTASSGGCTSMATFEMDTKAAPTFAFATDTVYIPKDEFYTLKMNVSSNFVGYMWSSTPDPSYAQGLPIPPADVPLASPDAPYTLTLTLTNENECSTSDAIYVSRALDFFIPNTFTPNSDNNHDTWMFRNIDQYIDYYDIQVGVFNRGGFQVYSATGYNNSSVVWDGRRNGNDLPIGTYYYVVKLVPKSSTGKMHTFKGSVTIIR